MYPGLKSVDNVININTGLDSFYLYRGGFQPTQYFLEVYRSYMKLQTVLANMGGVIKILMLIFKTLSKTFGSKSCSIDMVNELFYYSKTNNSVNNKDNSQLSILNDNYVKLDRNQYHSVNSSSMKMDKALSILENNVKIENIINFKEAKLSPLKLYFCKCCLTNQSKTIVDIYKKGITSLRNKIDIIAYIKNIQLLDNIVDTVYNKTQASIIKLYQLENLYDYNEKHKIREAEVLQYFKDKFKEESLNDVDMRIFNLLPKEKKLLLLKNKVQY